MKIRFVLRNINGNGITGYWTWRMIKVPTYECPPGPGMPVSSH